jgi:hypothetical protein
VGSNHRSTAAGLNEIRAGMRSREISTWLKKLLPPPLHGTRRGLAGLPLQKSFTVS